MSELHRHVQRRDPQLVAAAGAVPLGQPQHVPIGGVGHPVGDLADLVHHAAGLLPGRVGLVPVLGDRRPARTGLVPDPCQRVTELDAQCVDPPRPYPLHGRPQHIGRILEVPRLLAVHERAGPPGRPLHRGRGQLVGGRLGHPSSELVRLVDYHHVVLGDHRYAIDRVDGQQCVVGHHDRGLHRPVPGPLGEALTRERTAQRPEALPGRHRHLAPGPVRVPRRAVSIPRSTDSGLLLGPLPELDHLRAQGAGGYVDQGALVIGHTLPNPVQAGVVAPALEHRVGGSAAQCVLGAGQQGGEVALDQLMLQGQGRGGDHHPVVVQQRGNQVGQRLAGARTRLHEQVLTGLQRPLHRQRHLLLAGPMLTAQRVDRRGQHILDLRRSLVSGRRCPAGTSARGVCRGVRRAGWCRGGGHRPNATTWGTGARQFHRRSRRFTPAVGPSPRSA